MDEFFKFVQESYGIEKSLKIKNKIAVRPIEIFERPFAVDMSTGLMSMDGIFDVSKGEQLIGIYYTPTIPMPSDIQGYYYVISAPSGSGIKITWSPPAHNIMIRHYPLGKPPVQNLYQGRPLLRYINADFSNAKPGKYPLRFEAYEVPLSGVGPIRRPEWDLEKYIFVTKTTADHFTNNYVAECPEGNLVTHFTKVGVYPWMDWKKWIMPPTTAKAPSVFPPLIIPIDFSMEMHPTEPFFGKLGPLPYSDPLWKVLGAIAAILLAIASAILGGLAGSKDGKWVCEQRQGIPGNTICGLEGLSNEQKYLIAASSICGIIAGILGKLALSDGEDPFLAGEKNTDPALNEATTKETVDVQIDYLGFPNIAGPADLNVNWQFNRHTDSGNIYSHSDTWKIRANPVNEKTKTSKKEYYLNEDVTITSSFDHDGKLLVGSDAYVTGFLLGPNDQFKPINLNDTLNPGKYEYTNKFTSSKDIGKWEIIIIAQSVNKAREFDTPEESAKSIGGSVLNQILTKIPKRECVLKFVKSATFEIIPPKPVIE